MKRVLSAVLLALGLIAHADTHYVKAGNPAAAPPYTTRATAARFIGQAVAAASDGDTILVSTGRYALTSQVLVKKGVILRASGRREDTVVDGNNATRCFKLAHAAARVDGFTITRGRASDGAGVYNQAGTVINCAIVSNNAVGLYANGGGVYSIGGLIKNCDIRYNTAVSTNSNDYDKFASGAGLYGMNVTVEDSWIDHNSGSGNYVNGGGAFLNGGRMTYCSVMNNTASALWYAEGGGVNTTMGTILERCWISNNAATATEVWLYSTASADGGGVYLANGTVARNCLIAENSASSPWGFASGGGAWVSGSTLFHCTVARNTATLGGNNPSKGGGVTWGYNCVCEGSIIWLNTSSQGMQYFIGGQNAVDVNYTASDFLPAGTGNRNDDPLMANPAASNYRLTLNSPCLDAARPAITHTCDLDGYPRPLDGDTNGTAAADIGCYEYGDVLHPLTCDFDGDGRTEPAVMRAANGRLRLLKSHTWRTWDTATGAPTWKPAPADYDGDLLTDPAWYDPATGRWHIYESSNAYAERKPVITLGRSNDLPIPADYDGDGKADLAVRRAADGKLRVKNSSDAILWTSGSGNIAWIATPADYDGDGKADPAWYQPGTGTTPARWRIYESGNGFALLTPLPTFPAGANAVPVLGDFDGDGKIDRAVFIPGTGKFKVKESQSGQAWTSAIGNTAWKPALGDYNGDGLTDCAWFNPATARFVVLYSDRNNADNTAANQSTLPAFGAGPNDRPVACQPGK